MNLKNMPKLADRLLYIRKMYNLSQVELAEKAGTTQQAIQQAEKGKARQPRYLHKLAYVLDIPVDWLVMGVIEKPKTSVKKPKGLSDQSSVVLDNFFSMPEKDQELILELMKSRQGK